MVAFDEKVAFEGKLLAAEIKRRQELLVTAKRSPSPFRFLSLEYTVVLVLAIGALNNIFGKYTDVIWLGVVVYVVSAIHGNDLTLHRRLDALITLLGDKRLLGKFDNETKDDA